MKVWVSRYALSKGIYECEAVTAGYLTSAPTLFADGDYFVLGVNAHETKEAAITTAEVMRSNKIDALQREIERMQSRVAKLEALRFE